MDVQECTGLFLFHLVKIVGTCKIEKIDFGTFLFEVRGKKHPQTLKLDILALVFKLTCRFLVCKHNFRT